MNIMVATKQYAEYVKAAVKAGIDLIISGAGLPMELPKLVAGSKTKIAPIVSTVKRGESDLPLLGSSLPADAGSCGDQKDRKPEDILDFPESSWRNLPR